MCVFEGCPRAIVGYFYFKYVYIRAFKIKTHKHVILKAFQVSLKRVNNDDAYCRN